MAEEFNFDEWYVKMMAIPERRFDEELAHIEMDRHERGSKWLKRKEAILNPKIKAKKEVDDVWQKGLDSGNTTEE